MARPPVVLIPGTDPFVLDVEDHVPGTLRVLSFRGHEAMNENYVFEFLVVSPDADPRTVADTLGRAATFALVGVSPHPQAVHGVISAVSAEGTRERGKPLHRLRLVPRLALLDRRVTSRIFQDATVVDIVDAVLEPHGVRRQWELERKLAPRPYCVQYHESDLAFVTRMLAEEGIFFRFDHGEPESTSVQSREVLVLGDAASRAKSRATRGVGAKHPGESTISRTTRASTSSMSFTVRERSRGVPSRLSCAPTRSVGRRLRQCRLRR